MAASSLSHAATAGYGVRLLQLSRQLLRVAFIAARMVGCSAPLARSHGHVREDQARALTPVRRCSRWLRSRNAFVTSDRGQNSLTDTR